MSKHKEKQDKLKDKRKSSPPTIFENVVEQATERWEQLVNNPQFATALATALEQPLNLANRVQELVGASLRTMNIPTRDDYKQLSRQLDAIAGQLEALRERLEEIAEHGLEPATLPPASSSKAARRRKKAAKADDEADTAS